MKEIVHEFPKEIGNPATNALVASGITTLKQVSKMSDKELLAMHGVGPKAVRILRGHTQQVQDLYAEPEL